MNNKKNNANIINKNFLSPQELDEVFVLHATSILQSPKLLSTKEYIQHGNTSCYEHSLAVSYYSLKLANVLRLKYDCESLIKGALLHDYFLYDWHIKDSSHKLHGFNHPRTALNNAMKDYALNSKQKDIILCHMFPLTPRPPKHIEGLLVCVIDKVCSIAEILRVTKFYAAMETT